MEKAKIKLSTVSKIFNFLEKEKGEETPQVLKFLLEPSSFEVAEENLTATKFNNGEPIPEARTEEEWAKYGKQKTPAFIRNGNDVYYNHYAVMDERGICPPGWRVPTEKDLVIIKYRKLYKTFPLAGYRRDGVGPAYHVGRTGYYWSSTVDGSYAKRLSHGTNYAVIASRYQGLGLSVRCVRDKN